MRDLLSMGGTCECVCLMGVCVRGIIQAEKNLGLKINSKDILEVRPLARDFYLIFL